MTTATLPTATLPTNANNVALAVALDGAKKGTFTGIVTRLVGATRGPKGAKTRYSDALVHDTVVTGFSYRGLKARDRAILEAITDADLKVLVGAGHEAYDHPRRKTAALVGLTLKDFRDAVDAMIASCKKSEDGTNKATHDDVFESLEVNGSPVRGARVYVGPTDPTKTPAAPEGTVYLSGLRVGRTVLEEPVNGWLPAGKKGVASKAKGLITSTFKLPSRRFVSYKLDPNKAGEWVLRVGGQAATAADADGVSVDPQVVAQVAATLAA